RIAVEDIKQRFNAYIQRQDIALLPETAELTDIGHTFDEMGLPSVREATDAIANLFVQLTTHDVNVLSWNVTQALAEGLTSIE
ncbi:hypothetical protein, partial [Psychrobacter sp. W2-37-MNA-CIBAN-0211]